ncbi:MAG: CoA-binding protein [Candidatus Eisenbacteria bacterium]
MTTRAEVERFLSRKKLALAGASRSGKKFGNTVLKELLVKGYEVYPVHPGADEVNGLRAFRSLAEVPADVDALVVIVPPSQTESLVREATARGIRSVWIQQGAESAEAVSFCRENGINVISGECILMFAEPAAWPHRLHRWIRGLFGRLPAESGPAEGRSAGGRNQGPKGVSE